VRPAVAPSGEQYELSHGDQRAVIVEVGGGLRAYSYGDWQVLDGYKESEMCSGARGQPLIPWPNRLREGRYTFDGSEQQLPLSEPERKNAIHGLVRWANWTCAERSPARIVMHHTLHPQPGYPFLLELTIEYTLGDNGLTVHTTATNAGAEPCPYGAGVHPYVTVGTPTIDEGVVTAPAAFWLKTDDREIPVAEERVDGTVYDFRQARRLGDTKLDTGFADLSRDADGRARVVVSGSGRTVSVWFDANYKYLMLFTGDSLPEKGRRRRSLGVEPMTCAPNAFASGEGLKVIDPGEIVSASWGITAEPTQPASE
jgi:aldose 1-epimerase